jgi:hypothetical protein
VDDKDKDTGMSGNLTSKFALNLLKKKIVYIESGKLLLE